MSDTQHDDDLTHPGGEPAPAPAPVDDGDQLAEPAAASDDPGKQPLEHWAERRAILPEMLGMGDGARLNPDYWKLGRVKAHRGWASGQIVTEQEFDDAVDELSKLVAR